MEPSPHIVAPACLTLRARPPVCVSMCLCCVTRQHVYPLHLPWVPFFSRKWGTRVTKAWPGSNP